MLEATLPCIHISLRNETKKKQATAQCFIFLPRSKLRQNCFNFVSRGVESNVLFACALLMQF